MSPPFGMMCAMAKPPPGRGWYAVAGTVTVLGLAVAAIVLVTGVRSWLDGFPDLGERFRNGDTVSIDVRAGETVVLYVSPESAPAQFLCEGEVAGSPVHVTDAPTFTFFNGLDETWAARYELVADQTGTGRLTCVAPVGRGAAMLALGEKPDNGRLLRILGTTIAIAGGIALLSVAAGGGMVLGVWRRRRARRVRASVRSSPVG
jgi:hypothetical protein